MASARGKVPAKVFTVGHSDRTLAEFVELLEQRAIGMVADVRSVPRSRHNPQFDADTLPGALAPRSIAYRHFSALGGFRRPREDSPNTAWREPAFRGYADYMQTPEFAAALDELLTLAAERSTAIMCAEAVPWRCHRSLIADALVARGVQVTDVIGESSEREHRLTPFAKVENGRVTYPG